jgi:hypothetical protein
MQLPARFLAVLAFAYAATGTGAFAASPQIEGTPVPLPPKPDFSSMMFLIGTWQCSDLSSRRPGPFQTTEVFSLDPSGYWIDRDDTVHKASWIPMDIHSQTKYTYDRFAKRWVRITIGGFSGYAVATAPAAVKNTKTYTYVIQSKAPDVVEYAPEVFVKESDTKRTMTTSFTEANGHIVHVKESCTKS